MTQNDNLIEKADKLLALREDLYEMHFHKVDREWLIDAMVDFALNNRYVKEIETNILTDNEIDKIAKEYVLYNESKRNWVVEGMKLYREKLSKIKINK
jgi:hypothetical protein